MSSDLLKIIRSLKGQSDHNDHYGHHERYGNYHDGESPYGHHYRGHGRHFDYGLAFKTVREISGKLFQNKRLALLAIIAFLTITAVFLVLAVWLVVTLINLCGPLVSDIEKNGLKGSFDTLSKIVTRIWEGTGK